MSYLLRTDRSRLASPIAATIYEGRVARIHVPGDALMYSTGPEHRDIDEVRSIVDQLAGLKIYLNHPTIFPAKDSGQAPVGFVESGRLDDDTAVARQVYTSEEALAAIKAGTHELSLGYACVLDENRYQRKIVLDHLALVERARCGAACSLRVDMMEPIEKEEETMKVGDLEVPLNITINEDTKKVLETLASLDQLKIFLENLPKQTKTDDCACKNRAMPHTNDMSQEIQAKLDAALAEVADLTKKLADAEAAKIAAEVEATNARKDADAVVAAANDKVKAAEEAAVKAKTDAEDAAKTALDARVDARVALLVEAKGFDLKNDEGQALDLNKMSDREIKVAVIKHVDGEDVPADKVDAFVDGVYAGALKRGKNASGSRNAVRETLNQMRSDGAPILRTGAEAEKAAREAMTRDTQTAWTKNSN